jgi:hypothetical protein
MPRSKSGDRLGWILIHSHKQWDGDDAPQGELRHDHKRGRLWHWLHYRPISEGGPYTLLFAWQGKIFAEGSGDVTHHVEYKDYSFPFRLNEYRETRPVALADLRVRPCGSLVKLDDRILKAYRRLARS